MRNEIRQLVLVTARKYEVPPAYITAHVRGSIIHDARLEVWRVMILEMGILRTKVAKMFGRDLRRLRKSEIGF